MQLASVDESIEQMKVEYQDRIVGLEQIRDQREAEMRALVEASLAAESNLKIVKDQHEAEKREMQEHLDSREKQYNTLVSEKSALADKLALRETEVEQLQVQIVQLQENQSEVDCKLRSMTQQYVSEQKLIEEKMASQENSYNHLSSEHEQLRIRQQTLEEELDCKRMEIERYY